MGIDPFMGERRIYRSQDDKLTTPANTLVKRIHDRMPVLLHNDEFTHWLSRDNDNVSNLAELIMPYPSDLLEDYVVTNTVNHVSADSPACILPG